MTRLQICKVYYSYHFIDSISDGITYGNKPSSDAPKTGDKDLSPHTLRQQATFQHIMQHEKSAASIVCQLKHDDTFSEPNSSTNDVLGVVATLGKVNDDNLSRLFSFNTTFHAT